MLEELAECGLCEALLPLAQFNQFVAVFDPVRAFRDGTDKAAGFYRVRQVPYSASVNCTEWILDEAVEYAQPFPAHIVNNQYICGDVCTDCVQKFGLARDTRLAKKLGEPRTTVQQDTRAYWEKSSDADCRTLG